MSDGYPVNGAIYCGKTARTDYARTGRVRIRKSGVQSCAAACAFI